MRFSDLILKKRNGAPLSDNEIAYFISGTVSGEIKDYQVTAMLMALWFRGMDSHETAVLTDCMAHSGFMVDLSCIPGIKVDKHSTGGVGDKTTLVVGPIVASCGVPVAKMSGRGLGHTGGTLDKLESIPGMSVDLSEERFFEVVRDVGLSVIGQTRDIARADKILYALRDVTATIDSVPLIASSIMSKKLASGSDAILLDVKTGSGAFMKTLDASIELAQAMVDIGEANGRKTAALITDMDSPLGRAVGNSIEVIEAADTLRMRGPKDLTELCLQLSSDMLMLAGKGDFPECRALCENALKSGAAFAKQKAMVAAQGGDSSVLEDYIGFKTAPFSFEVLSEREGYIVETETDEVGLTAALLGAGRATKTDLIDHSAGIFLLKKTGDFVSRGEPIARLFTSKPDVEAEAREKLLSAHTFGSGPPAPRKLVCARVTSAGVEMF